ncbi:MAG: hypothetical protein HY403_07570 [Elusimicrobia bacterium]|nr:hypothetical protein [Elusimicrobiota bacterium]
MRRAALLSLLLLGACATAGTEREGFLDSERPRSLSSKNDTGSCRPFFVSPSLDWGEGAPRHSCWHRLWEVPTALVVVPVALGIMTSPIWVPLVLLH